MPGLFKKLVNNPNLSVMNFKDNDLSSESASNLLKLCKKNVFLEDLVLLGNMDIPYSMIEKINDECRENLLIRDFVIPKLPLASETGFNSKLMTSNSFKGYDTRSIAFQD